MKYKILQPLSFYAGALLILTQEQAHVRRAVLKPLGNDVYEVITEANFKVGEEIGFDGDLPKAMATSVEPVVMFAERPSLHVQEDAAAEAAAAALAKKGGK